MITDSQSITRAVKRLDSLGVKERQRVIERCSNTPSPFGSSFFAKICEEITDPVCRWYAIRALGDMGTEDALGPLLQILRLPDQEVVHSSLHRMAARSIGKLGKWTVEHVINLLQSSERETVIGVLDALGEIGASEAIPILVDYLNSGDLALVLWSALSLAKIGTPSVPSLCACLTYTADPRRSFIVIDALATICDPAVIPCLHFAANWRPDVFDAFILRSSPVKIDRLMTMLTDASQEPDLYRKNLVRSIEKVAYGGGESANGE